ncbi:MAG: PorV/PorQ family protein [bacterium]
MKKLFLIILLFVSGINASNAQLGSYAGTFSRMGFGARGLAMGNAMVSNIYGDVTGIYNPALATFQEEGLVNLGYTFLSLDRKMNFVGFTKKFKLPKQDKGGAGITIAWINAGVSDIDGRDNDTKQIGKFSTFENEFYLGTGFIISDQVSLGVGFKLYYSKLFDKVTASSFALDIGAVYKASSRLAFGLSVKDIGAKYEWQTTALYGSNGNTTTDKFPKVVDLGATYLLPKSFGMVSLGIQHYFNPELINIAASSTLKKTNNTVLKIGFEVKVIDRIKFRAGLDRMDFSTDNFSGNLKPSFGVGLNKNFSPGTSLGVDYSFQLEPYTHNPIQNIGLVFKFK